MNSKLLLLAISVAAFSSCTTLYKSGQTPDDVYYSPVRLYGGDDQKEDKKEEKKETAKYYYSEDRAIRLGINDRRWRYFDNEYSYNPYNYGFNYGYYYNPYFWPYPVFSPVFTKPSNPVNTTPRVANLGGYNPTYNNAPASPKSGGIRPSRYYNNTQGSAVGNVIRQILTPTDSYSNNRSSSYSDNNSSNNSRTYTPSTNTSSSTPSSSGSSSSGSGGVSRPPRGGGNQ